MTRRQILLTALALAVLPPVVLGAFSGAARGDSMEIFADDRSLGAEDAPLTIIEYSSLTCPHCAVLHAEALPRIKQTWVADGRARLIFRHYPLDGLALRAAALANCVKGERFFGFLDLLFENQQRWARADDPLKALGRIAGLAGIIPADVEACMGATAEMDKILAQAQHGSATFGVDSTPTLIVNGKRIEGALSFEEFDAIFAKIAAGS